VGNDLIVGGIGGTNLSPGAAGASYEIDGWTGNDEIFIGSRGAQPIHPGTEVFGSELLPVAPVAPYIVKGGDGDDTLHFTGLFYAGLEIDGGEGFDHLIYNAEDFGGNSYADRLDFTDNGNAAVAPVRDMLDGINWITVDSHGTSGLTTKFDGETINAITDANNELWYQGGLLYLSDFDDWIPDPAAVTDDPQIYAVTNGGIAGPGDANYASFYNPVTGTTLYTDGGIFSADHPFWGLVWD